MRRKTILKELLLAFAKIGLFTFGGGYAMLAIIENVCVEQKQWITHEEMMDIIVIAESTPGPIVLNCSTFVGYRQAGLPGAIAATLGIILPSFVIIYAISMFLDNLLEIALIANAFKGIKLAVGLLIIDAGFNMAKKLPKTRLSRILLPCAAAAMLAVNFFSLNFSSISLMLLGAAVGLCAAAIRHIRKGGEAA